MTNLHTTTIIFELQARQAIREVQAPYIRIRGMWLSKLGYKIGEKLDLVSNPDGSITVKKAGPCASE